MTAGYPESTISGTHRAPLQEECTSARYGLLEVRDSCLYDYIQGLGVRPGEAMRFAACARGHEEWHSIRMTSLQGHADRG